MATMSDYCKAYYVRDLRAFSGWSAPQELSDTDHLYLHDNFVVTRGIINDEDIVFQAVTEEWKKFASESLNFNPPVYESKQPNETGNSSGSNVLQETRSAVAD
jgi:hypothetical protein